MDADIQHLVQENDWELEENDLVAIETVEQNQQWGCAKFLLRVTEEHHLTHNGIDSLCDSIQWLLDSIVSQMTEKLKSQIPEVVNQTERDAILATCEVGDLFLGLKSRYLREKYYETYFNYVVSCIRFYCVTNLNSFIRSLLLYSWDKNGSG